MPDPTTLDSAPINAQSPLVPPEAFIKGLPPGAKISVGGMPAPSLSANPPETAIPRALDVAKNKLDPGDTSITPTGIAKSLTKNVAHSLGEGAVVSDLSDVDPATTESPTLDSMGQTLKTAGAAAKQSVTTGAGAKRFAKTAGNDALASATGIEPIRYAARAATGDYAGAAADAATDVGSALAQYAIGEHFAGAEPQSLAGEHPSVAAAALDAHAKNGGSTFDPRTGENLDGARKWAVSLVPEATHIMTKAPTVADYSQFVGAHRELFQNHPNAQVGTWLDPETGLHHFDVSATTSSKNAALRAAEELGEKSIYHLGRHELLSNPASPGMRPDVIPDSIDQRFDKLRQSSPPVEPYIGIHYSHQKLDYIDGSRRGSLDPTQPARTAGTEGARIHLGEENPGTGISDAPPGFYTYKAGSLGEPSVRARKFAQQVQGNFSFANVATAPEWQEGLQRGYQQAIQSGAAPQVASGAAINSAEHALRDAGYDGYYNPQSPHIRFIFDSHEATPLGAKPAYQSPGGRIAGMPPAPVQSSAKPTKLAAPSATPNLLPGGDPAGLNRGK